MISTTSAVFIALLALIAGLAAGALLWRALGPHQHRSRDLEKRLADAERRLGDYQAEVTEHFVETSRRVNELTRNYKEVHEYLASSAVKLSNPAVGRELRAAAQISWNEGREHREQRDEASHGELVENASEPQREAEASDDQTRRVTPNEDSGSGKEAGNY
jgi:uncharacterized membrane-anchored protein YhcB (DUF1043 family)